MPNASRKLNSRAGGRGPSLQQAFCSGAAADTDMTLTGIKLGDEIVSAVQIAPPNDTGTAAIIAKRTLTITAANTVQCSVETNSPANSQLLVTYWSY